MSLHFKKSGIQHEIIFFFNEEQHFKKTPNNSSHKLLAEYRELTAGLGGCSLSPCSWQWAAVSPQHTPQTASWKLSPLLWWSRWGAHTHRAAHKGRKREQSVSNPQPSRPREAQGKTNYKIASQTDAHSPTVVHRALQNQFTKVKWKIKGENRSLSMNSNYQQDLAVQVLFTSVLQLIKLLPRMHTYHTTNHDDAHGSSGS